MKTLPKKIKALASIAASNTWRDISNVLIYPDERIVATDGYILAEIDNSSYECSDEDAPVMNGIDPLKKLDKIIGFNGKELSKVKFPIKTPIKVLEGAYINANEQLVVTDLATTSIINSKEIKEPLKYEQLFPTQEVFDSAPSINLNIELLEKLLDVFKSKEYGESQVKLVILENKLMVLGQSKSNKNIKGLQMMLRVDQGQDLHEAYKKVEVKEDINTNK